MRKIFLGVEVSLDGFIEGPNGEYDWCLTDQDYGLKEFFKPIEWVSEREIAPWIIFVLKNKKN
jgi:dihydrofolate reductase